MYSKFFTAALLATSVAGASIRRDLPTILKAFTDIGAGIDKLTTGFTGWDGNAESAVPFLDVAKNLQDTIINSTAAIKASPPLDVIESVRILGPSNELTAKVDGIVRAIIAKKPQFDAAGLTNIVSQQIADQSGASKLLAESIVGQLPQSVQAIGGSVANGITDKLQIIIDVFDGKISPEEALPPTESVAPDGTVSR